MLIKGEERYIIGTGIGEDFWDLPDYRRRICLLLFCAAEKGVLYF